jgi:predicted GNAT family N-acyltransferase
MAAAWNLRLATSAEDVLKVMVVRGIVFIEEQQVDWEGEIDNYEDDSTHFLGEVDGQPVAAGRLRFINEDQAKIERIAVRPAWRGQGYARAVVQFILDHAARHGARRYLMHAQVHLQKFYEDFGFRREGDIFVECGIDHITMVREDA